MSLVDDSAELAAAKRANMTQRSTSLSADMSTTAPPSAAVASHNQNQNFSLSSIQEVPESVDSISVCKDEPNITNKSVGKLADPKGNSTQVRFLF